MYSSHTLCYIITHSFGGNTNHDPHILYTLSAIQILALYDSLHLVDIQKIASYVKSLEQGDGSFFGDKWGEVDTRFSYCALSILSLTGQLHSGIINIPRAVNFIERSVFAFLSPVVIISNDLQSL